MRNIIAQWVSAVVGIIAACVLLRYYSRPRYVSLYRKKWVLLVCVVLMVYSGLGLISAHMKYKQTRVPDNRDILNAIREKGVVASADTIHTSRHGYEVLVPAGFRFAEIESGPVSLVATKDQISMLVALHKDTASIGKIVSDTKENLLSHDSAYQFSEQKKRIISGRRGTVVEYTVSKDIQKKGLLVLIKKNKNAYFQIILSAPENGFPSQRLKFENIIKSFNVISMTMIKEERLCQIHVAVARV